MCLQNEQKKKKTRAHRQEPPHATHVQREQLPEHLARAARQEHLLGVRRQAEDRWRRALDFVDVVDPPLGGEVVRRRRQNVFLRSATQNMAVSIKLLFIDLSVERCCSV